MLRSIVMEKELARPLAYQALAWSMIYPTAERLAQLPDWWASLAEVLNVLRLPTGEIETALARLPEAEPARLQALQVEYTRLFINAVPHVLAPPYASAYSPAGLLMGQPAAAALAAYRQAGLALSPEIVELPDHLAAELEFMFYLSREELAAQEANDQPQAALWRSRQREFLDHHLLTWLPAWQARVAEADRTGFYAALARLIQTWLKIDAAALAGSLTDQGEVQL